MPDLRPQPGPQSVFASTPADIAIYGGSAGSGKSYGLILEPLRHVIDVPGFDAVIFRRTLADAKKPGATISECHKLYCPLGAAPRADPIEWRWDKGGAVTIGHLEHETDVDTWQSAQLPLICFDELTHFTRRQFFYMTSRLRSMTGVTPYVRATCNPDADSWVAELLAWWIDQDSGFPIKERSGVLRWYVQLGDELHWDDTREGLIARLKDEEIVDPYEELLPLSVTFIAASIYDNPILLRRNPGYLAYLKGLPLVERERLLKGNWKIRHSAGLLFKREWCEMVDAAPAELPRVRFWDLAATEKTQSNNPDWTVGLKMAGARSGPWYVEHVIRMRRSPGWVEDAVLNTAGQDGRGCIVAMKQDPGQASKSQIKDFVAKLAGYTVHTSLTSGDKVTNFSPFSSQCEAGNVRIVRGPWNNEFFVSLEGFPDARHDDDADGCSGAFRELSQNRAGRVTVRELRV
jgi:predicted phage terminase large subunit-like protein